MRVLVINPGSSSVKLAVVEDDIAVTKSHVDEPSAQAAREPLIELVRRRPGVTRARVVTEQSSTQERK